MVNPTIAQLIRVAGAHVLAAHHVSYRLTDPVMFTAEGHTGWRCLLYDPSSHLQVPLVWSGADDHKHDKHGKISLIKLLLENAITSLADYIHASTADDGTGMSADEKAWLG